MGALKSALTGSHRLMALAAVFVAIALAMFMCGGVGNVAAEEVLLEVPHTLATVTNNIIDGVFYGLTVVEWIIAASGVISLLAFLLVRDFRLMIIAAALLVILVVMTYI